MDLNSSISFSAENSRFMPDTGFSLLNLGCKRLRGYLKLELNHIDYECYCNAYCEERKLNSFNISMYTSRKRML